MEAHTDDFLQGYYGAAAPHLRAYIDRMHDELEASGEGLGIFGNPHTPPKAYLSEEMLEEYDFLNLAQIHAALSYYYENPDEVEAAFAEDEAAVAVHERRVAERSARRAAE